MSYKQWKALPKDGIERQLTKIPEKGITHIIIIMILCIHNEVLWHIFNINKINFTSILFLVKDLHLSDKEAVYRPNSKYSAEQLIDCHWPL